MEKQPENWPLHGGVNLPDPPGLKDKWLPPIGSCVLPVVKVVKC